MGAGKETLNAFWAESQWAEIPRLQDRSGRAGGIRTHGLHVPNVALYQAEPQPVINGSTEVIARWERKQPLIFSKEKRKGIFNHRFHRFHRFFEGVSGDVDWRTLPKLWASRAHLFAVRIQRHPVNRMTTQKRSTLPQPETQSPIP
jgi:hypothetical protein